MENEQRAKRCCVKKDKGPASLFCREAEVLFGALKTKSCLSGASSFCLVEKSAGVGKKVQTAIERKKQKKALAGYK